MTLLARCQCIGRCLVTLLQPAALESATRAAAQSTTDATPKPATTATALSTATATSKTSS